MRTLRLGALFAVICLAGLAQPKVASIVGAAYSQSDVSVRGLGAIYGSGLASAEFKAATTPWPTKLGDTDVLLCPIPVVLAKCVNAGLLYVNPTQINFYVPPTVPGSGFVIRRAGIPNTDATAQSAVVSYQFFPSPTIFLEGYDCFIDPRFKDANINCGLTSTPSKTLQAWRGAVTDQQGRILSSSNPATLGQYYTVWMTGVIPSALNLAITNIPVYGYPGDTWDNAVLSYVGESSQYPGLYQINFQLPTWIAGARYPAYGYPPLFPCGNYSWEVSLSFAETGQLRPTDLVQVPIIVKPGDIPGCAH